MFRRFASLFVCAAVGVAMLCMRPTAALAGGLDIDFTMKGKTELVTSTMTKEELLGGLPAVTAQIPAYGLPCYHAEIPVHIGWRGGNYSGEFDGGMASMDYALPFNSGGAYNTASSGGIPYPYGTGRILGHFVCTSATAFPAGKYYIARSSMFVRAYCNVSYDYVSETVPDLPSWTGFQSKALSRSVVAYWDADAGAWVEFPQDEDGFCILSKPTRFFAFCFVTNSDTWPLTLNGNDWNGSAGSNTQQSDDSCVLECLPTFSIGGLWESQQIINVLNGDDGSTVTGTINNQTSTLMDTSGADSIVSGATAGGVSSLVARLGFIGQIPQVVSSFLAPIGSASASDGLFFPGVTVLGYELIPAQMVPVWQNGLAALETPIKAFNTGVLAVLFVKGAKHVLHKDLLGWDDEEGDSE